MALQRNLPRTRPRGARFDPRRKGSPEKAADHSTIKRQRMVAGDYLGPVTG